MKVVSLIREKTGYIVSPDAMFDVQVCFCNRISGLAWTGGEVHGCSGSSY